MSSDNGNHVTRAELKANLDPIRNDVTEIKADVKTLLAAKAGANAIWKALSVAATIISGFSYFGH